VGWGAIRVLARCGVRGPRSLRRLVREAAADRRNATALGKLARIREKTGDQAGAGHLAREAADRDATTGLRELARIGEATGDQASAEQFYREAVDFGDGYSLTVLASLWEKSGKQAIPPPATGRA
jgi:hypothetical protein